MRLQSNEGRKVHSKPRRRQDVEKARVRDRRINKSKYEWVEKRKEKVKICCKPQRNIRK